MAPGPASSWQWPHAVEHEPGAVRSLAKGLVS